MASSRFYPFSNTYILHEHFRSIFFEEYEMEQETTWIIGTHTLSSGDAINFYVLGKGNKDYENLFWKGGAMAANLADGTQAILILKEVADQLTEDELVAILNHEIGHLECGHLDDKNIHGLLVDEQLEIEADCYALQFSSKRDLRNACYKLMEIRFGIKERWRAAVQFFAPQWRRGLRLMF